MKPVFFYWELAWRIFLTRINNAIGITQRLSIELIIMYHFTTYLRAYS